MSRKEEFLTQLGLNPKGRYMFHGTSPENAESIMKEGFKVGMPERNNAGNIKGIYLAKTPDEAADYGPEVIAVHMGKTKVDKEAYWESAWTKRYAKTNISDTTAMKRTLKQSGSHAFIDPDEPHTIVVDPQHLRPHGHTALGRQFE